MDTGVQTLSLGAELQHGGGVSGLWRCRRKTHAEEKEGLRGACHGSLSSELGGWPLSFKSRASLLFYALNSQLAGAATFLCTVLQWQQCSSSAWETHAGFPRLPAATRAPAPLWMEKPLGQMYKKLLEEMPGFLHPEEHKDVPGPSSWPSNFYFCYTTRVAPARAEHMENRWGD